MLFCVFSDESDIQYFQKCLTSAGDPDEGRQNSRPFSVNNSLQKCYGYSKEDFSFNKIDFLWKNCGL